MSYFCSDCKKSISDAEFYYSMNRHRKALCSDHQRSAGLNGTTQRLQELMKERQGGEVIQDVPKLRSVKDWIAADFETWDKVLSKREEERKKKEGMNE
jgi:hypothetical protein